MGKRGVKKGPAPRAPTDSVSPSAPPDADVAPPVSQVPLHSPTPSEMASSTKTHCPGSPGPTSPRIPRPTEKPPDRPQPPPERPPMPSSRASVVPASPGATVKFERSESPSVGGMSGDERATGLYPSLSEFDAGSSSGGETPIRKHIRNASDTGLPARSPRPTSGPPPPPVGRRGDAGDKTTAAL
jgi:hypothetical protein